MSRTVYLSWFCIEAGAILATVYGLGVGLYPQAGFAAAVALLGAWLGPEALE